MCKVLREDALNCLLLFHGRLGKHSTLRMKEVSGHLNSPIQRYPFAGRWTLTLVRRHQGQLAVDCTCSGGGIDKQQPGRTDITSGLPYVLYTF